MAKHGDGDFWLYMAIHFNTRGACRDLLTQEYQLFTALIFNILLTYNTSHMQSSTTYFLRKFIITMS